MPYVITYIISLVSLCLLDYLWLGVIMKNNIQHRMWHLMKDQFARGPAITFYMLYCIGILVFAIIPAVRNQNILYAIWFGALLWFISYMTYDLTNRATLKDRPIAMVLPDIVWWTLVTAIVASIGYYAYIKIGF